MKFEALQTPSIHLSFFIHNILRRLWEHSINHGGIRRNLLIKHHQQLALSHHFNQDSALHLNYGRSWLFRDVNPHHLTMNWLSKNTHLGTNPQIQIVNIHLNIQDPGFEMSTVVVQRTTNATYGMSLYPNVGESRLRTQAKNDPHILGVWPP